jgi:transcription elongation GreA/GreB family factor
MIRERKRFFVDGLKAHYQEIISGAHQAETRAAEAAGEIQREARRKEDAKSSVEFGRMAAGHGDRRARAKAELEKLIAFASRGLHAYAPDAPVQQGALVDVSIDGEAGSEERTLFVLPVGAGTELTGPGGDGFVSVITLASPVGQAIQGARAGDTVDVVIAGQEREWTVVEVC